MLATKAKWAQHHTTTKSTTGQDPLCNHSINIQVAINVDTVMFVQRNIFFITYVIETTFCSMIFPFYYTLALPFVV